MKKYVFALFLLISVTSSAFAKNPPLRVAIPQLSPPFVMQSGNQQFYGFDIATIEYVCRALDRPCEYLPMQQDALIPALRAGRADVAVGAIIITLKRSRLVRFSLPYLVSKAQFMTTDESKIPTPFKLQSLNGKRIGVLRNSAYEHIAQIMKIDNPSIITFENDSDMVQSLRASTLDVALFSALKLEYWQGRSQNILKPVGRAFPVGFGFAIAINPNETTLINKINLAIVSYRESYDFKQNYTLYFPESF